MSYILLKCVISISNNVYLPYKFLCDFIQESAKSAFFPKIQEKFWLMCLQKLYLYHLSKLVYCKQNFVRFHAVESEIELPQDFWEKLKSSAPYWAICTQITSLLFLIIYILCTFFVQFHPLETKISISQKFRKSWNYSTTYEVIFTKS